MFGVSRWYHHSSFASLTAMGKNQSRGKKGKVIVVDDTVYKQKGGEKIPHLPGMQVFRHGVQRPQIVNDMAGVSLRNLTALTTAPHYFCKVNNVNKGKSLSPIGPLHFHHLVYSMGARMPHRPVIIRGVIQTHGNVRYLRLRKQWEEHNRFSDRSEESHATTGGGNMVAHWSGASSTSMGTGSESSVYNFRDAFVMRLNRLSAPPASSNTSEVGSESVVGSGIIRMWEWNVIPSEWYGEEPYKGGEAAAAEGCSGQHAEEENGKSLMQEELEKMERRRKRRESDGSRGGVCDRNRINDHSDASNNNNNNNSSGSIINKELLYTFPKIPFEVTRPIRKEWLCVNASEAIREDRQRRQMLKEEADEAEKQKTMEEAMKVEKARLEYRSAMQRREERQQRGDGGAQGSIPLMPLDPVLATMMKTVTPSLPTKESYYERQARYEAVEPWKVGVSIDPTNSTTVTQDTIPLPISTNGNKETLATLPLEPISHPDTESIFVAMLDIVFTVHVPEQAIDMCRDLNKKRVALQHMEGYRNLREKGPRRPGERAAVPMDRAHHSGEEDGSLLDFGLKSRTHTIKLTVGDAMFLPQGWKYTVSLAAGTTTRDVLTGEEASDETTFRKFDPLMNAIPTVVKCHATKTSSTEEAEGSDSATPSIIGTPHAEGKKKKNIPIVAVECAALRYCYKPYPILDDEEARLYLSADYVTDLSKFYSPNPLDRRVLWK